MKTIHFNSFKIANRIPVNKIALFFKNENHQNIKREYIVLKEKHLDTILKYNTAEKEVYLFEFGCITFINFSSQEIRIFLDYIESFIGKVNYDMFGKYYEEHSITIFDNGKCELLKEENLYVDYHPSILYIISSIMAKSLALYKIENDVDVLLDKALEYLVYLKKGLLRVNAKKFAKTTANLLRFEYEVINNIRIFDRNESESDGTEFIKIHNLMVEYYELFDRFSIVKNKIEHLRSITNSYSTLSFEKSETRRYVLEIFLLALFPLSSIIDQFIDIAAVIDIFKTAIR